MRMWMVEVQTMCTKHLLGEHVETHMFLWTLKKRISVSGYIKNNLFEPESLLDRHEDIRMEMTRRWMNHNSIMSEEEVKEALEYLPSEEREYLVDRRTAKYDLHSRCKVCYNKYQRRADRNNSK